jgi:4-amino-4-deoxy-L-arabinose transferase-like glycosyltransferase
MWRQGTVLGAILLLAISIQVGMVLAFAEPSGGGGPDSLEYRRHAISLLRRGIYSFDGTTPDRMRQPVYPLFLAGVYVVFGDSNAPVYYVQAGLNTASVFLVWKLALMLGLSGRAGAGAALLVAVYPPFARLSALVLTETLSILLLLCFALLFVRTASRPDAGRAIAVGAIVGVHTLCRPITALLPLCLPLMFWFVLGRFGPAARIGLLAALGFTLAVAPWAVRNTVVLGRPTFLSTEGGAGAYVGTRPDAEQIWEQGLGRFVESAEVRAIIGDEYYISEEADARFRAAALSRFLGHPAQTLVHGVVQVLKAWAYMPGIRAVAREHPWLWGPLVGVEVICLLLALYGALTARSRVLSVLLLGIPAYYTAILVPLFAVPRHMLPLFPLVAIGAATGASRILARLAPGRVAESPSIAGATPDRAGP